MVSKSLYAFPWQVGQQEAKKTFNFMGGNLEFCYIYPHLPGRSMEPITPEAGSGAGLESPHCAPKSWYARERVKKFEESWGLVQSKLAMIKTSAEDTAFIEDAVRTAFSGQDPLAAWVPLEHKIFLMAYLVLRARHPELPLLKRFRAITDWNFHISTRLYKVLDAFVNNLIPKTMRAPPLTDLIREKFVMLGFDANNLVVNALASICSLVVKECRLAPPCYTTFAAVYSVLRIAGEVDETYLRTQVQVAKLFNISNSRLSIRWRAVASYLVAQPALTQVIRDTVAGASPLTPPRDIAKDSGAVPA